jgi:hypothetical protein
VLCTPGSVECPQRCSADCTEDRLDGGEAEDRLGGGEAWMSTAEVLSATVEGRLHKNDRVSRTTADEVPAELKGRLCTQCS